MTKHDKQEIVLSKTYPHTGVVIVWYWGDREIENPNLLKRRLVDIKTSGFSGVYVCLGSTRYEMNDCKVVRAAVQVSQWTKRRGMCFWFQTDPRRASRSIVSKTGERIQLVLLYGEYDGNLRPNLVEVRKNKFNMRIPFPKEKSDPAIYEIPMNLEPSGLERSFLLQIENGKAISRTVRDITAESRFFPDARKRTVDVFGEVQVPQDETWVVLAFPRFETNLYDYSGRKNIDQLLPFIEAMFESGLYLDKAVWDSPCDGNVAGRLPVSPSSYNSFIADHGYDLCDALPKLVLEFDDASHIPVRHDCASHFMETVLSALKDFDGMLHPFFSQAEIVMMHNFRSLNRPVPGAVDPWQGLAVSGSGASEIRLSNTHSNGFHRLLAALIETKSLGVFSKMQKAFLMVNDFDCTRDELGWWMDLAALYSVHWMIRGQSHDHCKWSAVLDSPDYLQGPDGEWFAESNRHYDAIGRITGFKCPDADTLLVLPFETLTSCSPMRAEEILADIERMIYELTLRGIQLDVVSSSILKKAKLDRHGLYFRNRIYPYVLYPYPDVLSPEVLELISMMEETDFPALLGGTRPQYLVGGEVVPCTMPVSFDPKDEGFMRKWQTGRKQMFRIPDNGLGSVIQTGTETLLLFCPKELGGTVYGRARYQKTVFHVAKSKQLTIYRLKDNVAEKIF